MTALAAVVIPLILLAGHLFRYGLDGLLVKSPAILLIYCAYVGGPVCYFNGVWVSWHGDERGRRWLIAGACFHIGAQLGGVAMSIHRMGWEVGSILMFISGMETCLIDGLVLAIVLRPETRRALFPG